MREREAARPGRLALIRMRNTTRANVLMLSLGGLILLAWAALWSLDQSPWGALFHAHGDHRHHAGIEITGAGRAALFVGGWTLMTIAMMLPSTLPLVAIFERLVRARDDRAVLVTLLLSGYLLVWSVFGGVALVSVFGVLSFSASKAAISSWPASAALFLLAGAFQFSPLKYRCLDACRTPLAFVTSRWQGRRPRYDAFRTGLAHGAFCVGCCWALMLLMFAVSTASLLWMLVLGTLMAVEKNVSWGRRFAAPLGVVLMLIGAGSFVRHIW